MAAEVVSCSRLLGHDESGTVARLRYLCTKRFEPALVRLGGRLVKLTGDGAPGPEIPRSTLVSADAVIE
ncbi:MAG: hypothetical protein KIT36_01330 [Alphaproteobacteria bacterium]|nr:hypothetical protein [Alphaproteobacteria bacterium]